MKQERRYYVYIMASQNRVIYVGVTGFLMARVLRHKAGEGGSIYSKVSYAPVGLFSEFPKRRRRYCAGDRN